MIELKTDNLDWNYLIINVYNCLIILKENFFLEL